MNPRLLELWASGLKDAKAIAEGINMDEFLEAVKLLFTVNLCRSCSSTINDYYFRMKKWFEAQEAKGCDFTGYDKRVAKLTMDKPIEEPKEEIVEPEIVAKPKRKRK